MVLFIKQEAMEKAREIHIKVLCIIGDYLTKI